MPTGKGFRRRSVMKRVVGAKMCQSLKHSRLYNFMKLSAVDETFEGKFNYFLRLKSLLALLTSSRDGVSAEKIHPNGSQTPLTRF